MRERLVMWGWVVALAFVVTLALKYLLGYHPAPHTENAIVAPQSFVSAPVGQAIPLPRPRPKRIIRYIVRPAPAPTVAHSSPGGSVCLNPPNKPCWSN